MAAPHLSIYLTMLTIALFGVNAEINDIQNSLTRMEHFVEIENAEFEFKANMIVDNLNWLKNKV